MPNSKTLLQAILAAFCAILCALSSLGGGGMNRRRILASLGLHTPTAKDYVQDGLVAMWDGIENAGWGQHNPNAVVWKSLVGSGYDGVISGDCVWNDNNLLINSVSNQGLVTISKDIPAGDKTMEVVYRYKAKTSLGRVLDSNGYEFLFYWRDLADLRDQHPCLNAFGYDYKTEAPVESISKIKSSQFSFERYGTGTSYYSDGLYKRATPMYHNRLISSPIWLGNRGGDYARGCDIEIYALRFYSRPLGPTELSSNYAIDKARFNLPDVA